MVGLDQISINFVPRVVFFIFVSFFFLFLLNIKTITRQFKKINKRTWFVLIIILLLALGLRFFVVPHHFRMFTDEPGHVEAAKNILNYKEAKNCGYLVEESCSPYMRQLGWPMLLSLWFLFFGVNNYVAINLTALLGSISVILMFLLGYLSFKKESIGLWASFLLCLTPIHVTWSGTAEPNVPSLFFALLTLLFFIIYFKEKSLKMHFLAIFSLIFTIQIRSEFLLLLPIIFSLYVFFGVKIKDNWLPWLGFLVLLPPFLIQAHLDMIANLNIYGRFFFNLPSFFSNLPITLRTVTNDYNILFLVPLVAGVWLLRKRKRKFTPLLAIFLIFFLLYTSFEKPATRMLLLPNLILIFFSAYGLDFLANKLSKIKFLLVILLIFSFYPPLASIKTMPHQALETKIPELAKKDILPDCYIITEWPETLACTTDFKLVDSLIPSLKPEYIDFLYNKTDCVLFYEDIYCKLYNSKKCKLMHETFNLTEYKTYIGFGVNYTFYKVSKKV